MFTYEYIKDCLDARGMPTDEKTVRGAKQRWEEIITQYEDDFFTEVMNESGIKGFNDE